MLGLLGVPTLVVLKVLWTDAPAGSTLVWTGVMVAGALAGLALGRCHVPLPFETTVFYQRLGVRAFGRWLGAIGSNAAHPQGRASLRNIKANPEALASFDAQTRANERGHLLWLGVTIGATIAAIWLQRWVLALWLIGANVIVNLYPILLQRYTRLRLRGRERWR